MKQCKKTPGAFGKWVRLSWFVGAGGWILGHGGLLHIHDLCLARLLVSWIARAVSCRGRIWSKADLWWFELKNGRLNAAGPSLWSVLAQPNALPGALRGAPHASWFASLCGLPWQSVAAVHALPWNMLMQLKMLPGEKFFLVLGRQWIGDYWEIFIRISHINLSQCNLCFLLCAGYSFPPVKIVRRQRVVPDWKKPRVSLKSCTHMNAEKDVLKNTWEEK